MDANEINPQIYHLANSIHHAIINSVHSVVGKCTALGNSPQEPDFIASLTLEFTADLFDILKATFPKIKFSVTGIFCHQKPIVDIGLSKAPELGDILFVYIHTDAKSKKRYNSLLLQAKMTSTHATRIPSGDLHQLTLYRDWPDFTYRRASTLNGITRSIQPKVSNDGAQYLLIDNHPVLGLTGGPGTFPMGCSLAQDILHLDNNLSFEIIDFLKFKSGRAFEADPASTNDDWTKMIWEMIEITKTKASRRKNAGLNSFPRMISNEADGLFYLVSESPSIFSDLQMISNDGDDSKMNIHPENGALSVIVIESTQEQSEE